MALKLKGGASGLETESGEAVKCTANTGVATALGNKGAAKTLVTFTGCELKAKKCESAGKGAGEVVTSELKGELVYLGMPSKESEPKIGLKLEPEKQPFASFKCGTDSVAVKGSVIGQITPVNTLTASLTVTWRKATGKKGKQEWLQIEEAGSLFQLETEIEGAKAEASALEAEDSIATESGEEIGVGTGESTSCEPE